MGPTPDPRGPNAVSHASEISLSLLDLVVDADVQ